MFLRLLHKSKYYHLKLIHEHPKGIQNRFKNNADKWIQSLRHPHVKTYADYYYNNQMEGHTVKIKFTEKEQNSVEKIKHSYKPGIAALTEILKINKNQRPDDLDMERDVKEMTITKFIQEGKQNFTPTHRLVAYSLAFIALHIILYFTFMYGKQLPKNQRVKVLNAQFLETYHFQNEQSDLKRIIERIEIVNAQFENKLSESRNK